MRMETILRLDRRVRVREERKAAEAKSGVPDFQLALTVIVFKINRLLRYVSARAEMPTSGGLGLRGKPGRLLARTG